MGLPSGPEGVEPRAERLAAGACLGKYEIQGFIGGGGMGEVYRARDTQLGRPVAIKLLRTDVSVDLAQHRFAREISIAARLQHPHILPLHDSGETNGRLWYTMPFVEGETLRDRLVRDQRLPIGDAVSIAREVAGALAHAHQHGIVHRDIKPENILLSSGHAVVADFGIAGAILKATVQPDAATREMTAAGAAIGTLTYMSPEQAAGERWVDGRSDLYSLGCVMYEMLAGRAPHEARTAQERLTKRLTGDVVPLTHVRPGLPAAVDRIVMRALAPTPADRWPTADDLRRALTEVPTEASPAPEYVTPLAPVRAESAGWFRRHRALVVAVGLVAAVAAGGAIWWRARQAHGPSGNIGVASADLRVVAVLPFEHIAADASKKYFADGMTEELTSQLARSSALRVMSRAAVMQYTRTPEELRRLAPELGVGSIVTGTVRPESSRVRIDVQLANARTNQTLWAEQYDRQLTDVFAVQRDVAMRIVETLQARVSVAEQQRVEATATRDLEAYQLYLQAKAMPSSDRERNAVSIALLERAVRRDPQFAVAYATLARRLGFLGDVGDRRLYDKALIAAEEAVRVGPSVARAHHALADTYRRLGRLADARLSFLRASELEPSYAAAMYDLSITEFFLGHYDQSLYWARRAFPLEPNVAYSFYHVGVPLVELADNDAADRWLIQSEKRLPTYLRIQLLRASVELFRGDDRAALERLRRVVAAEPGNQEGQVALAETAFLTGSADAETLIGSLATQAPAAHTDDLLPETFRTLHAYLLAKSAHDPKTTEMFDASLASAHRELSAGSQSPAVPMEIAAIHAFRGEPEEAVKWLNAGYDAGWRQYRETARDPLFANLRDDPRFKQVLDKMRSDVDEMRRRANVDANPAMPPIPQDPPAR